MRTFTDNTGREWTVAVNVDALKRVQGLIGVNLIEQAIDGKLFTRLAVDPILLCDIIYALCRPQAESAGVSDDEFGRAMGGDAIQFATTALLEELVDFFPNPRRNVLRRALAKSAEIDEERMALIQTKIDRLQADELSGAGSSSLPE